MSSTLGDSSVTLKAFERSFVTMATKRPRNKVSIKSTIYRTPSRPGATSRPSTFDGPWKASLSEALQAFLEKLEKEGITSAYQMFVARQVEPNRGECDVKGQWYTSDHELQSLLVDGVEELKTKRPGFSFNPKPTHRYQNIFSGGALIGREDLWGAEVDQVRTRLLDFDVPGVRLHTILRHVAEKEILPAVLRFPQGEFLASPGDLFDTLSAKYQTLVGVAK